MGIRLKLLALAMGILFLVLVIRAIRRSYLKPSYSILWIGVALFLLSVPSLEFVYRWIAYNLLGITDARHTVYSALLGFLLLYALYLTTKVTRMDDRIQQLISFTAVLEKEVREVSGERSEEDQDRKASGDTQSSI